MPEATIKTPIKKYCDLQGRKYTWLAKKLGLSLENFLHIEAGRRNAPAGYYERAAELLGVDVDLLRPDAATPSAAPERAAGAA